MARSPRRVLRTDIGRQHIAAAAVTHRPPARSPPLISKAGAARLVSTGHSASFDPPAVPLRAWRDDVTGALQFAFAAPSLRRASSIHCREHPYNRGTEGVHRNSRSLHMSDSIVFHGFSQTICVLVSDNLELWEEALAKLGNAVLSSFRYTPARRIRSKKAPVGSTKS